MRFQNVKDVNYSLPRTWKHHILIILHIIVKSFFGPRKHGTIGHNLLRNHRNGSVFQMNSRPLDGEMLSSLRSLIEGGRSYIIPFFKVKWRPFDLCVRVISIEDGGC